MESFETIDCINCGSDRLYKVCEKGQFNIPTHVCVCEDCGLSFLSPRWTEQKYLDFYQNDYDKYYRPNVITQSYRKNADKDPYSYYPILKRLQDRGLISNATKKYLDIGSGSGQKLEIFKSIEFIDTFYAIEPSKACFEQLKNRGVQVITNDISADWEKAYQSHFDLITMRHVLEHFMNPLEVLQKLRSTLSPNGIIYIAIPNALILENRQLLKSFFRVVHTFYFNKYSIQNLVHKAGYEIIDLQEGDEIHGLEIFLMIKPTSKALPITIDSSVAEKQKAAYESKILEEMTLKFKTKQFIKEQWQQISNFKKAIFPR